MPVTIASLASGGIVIVAAGAVVAVAIVCAILRRRPDALPVLAIAALPFRLPISAEGRTVNLLIPLYVVVAAGTLVQLVPRIVHRREAPPRGVEWVLAATVALYALQTAYSSDAGKAAENLAFFYVPFSLLLVLLRDVRWTRELLLACLAVAAALGFVFAGVGFVEYSRKALFLNPKVVAANQYDNYFRVNSLFFDPNIYGRFLALVMVALTGIVLWRRRRGEILACAALLGWLLAGLVTSFSQSSIAALLLGLAVMAAWRWGARATLYWAGALVALGVGIVLAAPASLHFGLKGSGGSTSNATSGRGKLISGGLEVFAKRPLWGYGSGSFETEYKRQRRTSAQNATSASHTIPVTIAAEQGLIGLGLYVALIVLALRALFKDAGRSPPRIAIAACFAALLLHTWTYADFLEDPMTWTLLGIGLALARRPAPDRRAQAGVAPEPAGAGAR